MEKREASGAAVVNCPNCATPARGRWCHACGQDNRRPRMDTRTLIVDAFHGFTDLDSRFLRTVRGLSTRPGAFIAEYVAGHRADRVRPFRYMLVMIAAILVLTPWTHPTGTWTSNNEAQHAALGFVQRFFIIFTVAGVFLSAAALWFCNFRRERNYAECVSFAMYAIGQTTLLSMVLLAVRPFGFGIYYVASLVGMLAYWGWAIRGFFRVGVFGAFWRMLVMFFFYMMGTVGLMGVVILASAIAHGMMSRGG